MVRGQKIVFSEFAKMNKMERDAELLRAYGITADEISDIRSIASDNPYLGLKEAAKLLYEKSGDLSCVNMAIVSNMALEEYPDSHNNAVRGGQIVLDKQKERRKILEAQNLFVPSIYFIEEDLGISESNLIYLKEDEIYDNFVADRFDFIRNIRLPKYLGYTESQLLGIMWAKISNGQFESSETRGNVCQMNFKINKNELLYNFIVPKFYEIFNIPLGVTSISESDQILSYHSTFHSDAIVSWLRDDVGFGDSGSNKLPTIDYNKKAFAEGIIASKMGMYVKNPQKGKKSKQVYFTFSSADKEFIDRSRGLFKDLDFHMGAIFESRGNTEFHGKNYKRSVDNFTITPDREFVKTTNFIDPYQKRGIDKIYQFIREKNRNYIPKSEKTRENAIKVGSELMKQNDGVLPTWNEINHDNSWIIRVARKEFDGFPNYRRFMEEEYAKL